MIRLPEPKPDVMARRDAVIAGLRAAVADEEGVIADPISLKPYETDGLSAYRQMPLAVALPETTEEVAAIMRFCHANGVRVVPRGAGTSLSGGALPLADAVVVGLMRMNQILNINYPDRCATVQAGVTNIGITNAVSDEGFFYAPDPSSQLACMIGGNVNMNSGGAHCLKYGVTANNLLGLKIVTVDGEILDIGGEHLDAAGYDWLGLLTGSEGQLALVTEITVRILRSPEGARAMLAGFASNEVAGECVDAIISSGIIPVALEFMDRPAIHACEAFAHAGYPLDAEAMLIIEVEGSVAEQDDLLARLSEICNRHNPISLKVSQSAEESLAIWKGRKGAFGAIGRISPDYLCMDGTIPTSKLPDVLRRIQEMSDSYGLKVANIFHAGDGNLHPLIMFDANDPSSFHKAETFGADILKLCVDVGGCLTGEHGVGVEKRDLMPYQFAEHELEQQRRIKSAFDPEWLLNPSKVFPLRATCLAAGGMTPTAPELEIAERIARSRQPLLVQGAGTKSAMLRPVQAGATLSTESFDGITLYRPKELIISALAGTRLHAIETTLRENGQHLIAEPPDLSALLGTEPQTQTIGGVVATNLSGPRRVAWGAMRDHVMGVRAVTGRAEVIHSGGRVLKNVTGLDLCKLLTGSHGTLGVITEVTLKVLPAPEAVGTIVIAGLDAEAAVTTLSAALGSPYGVSGAAWLPAEAAALLPATLASGRSLTLIRIEDFAASVAYRTEKLRGELGHAGAELRDDETSRLLWGAIRDVRALPVTAGDAIWRVSVRPSSGPGVLRAVPDARGYLDWGGGLVWLAGPATETTHRAIEAAARAAGGVWTLVRAPDSLRGAVDAVPPEAAPLAAITRRVKHAMDPRGILNPGRIHAGL